MACKGAEIEDFNVRDGALEKRCIGIRGGVYWSLKEVGIFWSDK